MTPSVRDWAAEEAGSGCVERMTLRDGVTLILSRFAPVGACAFDFVEPEDTVGIGFHLRGGARFHGQSGPVETAPFDIWCGLGREGTTSRFELPAGGFQTVSIRMTPEAARALCGTEWLAAAGWERAAGLSMRRSGVMDAAAADLTAGLLDCAFAGSARRLFLEGGALGLLARQLAPSSAPAGRATRRKLEQAREHLDAHLADPPGIVALARMVGLNDFALKRDFKRAFGTTVFGYVRERRMMRAAADLLGGMSVQEAAMAVGYESPRCFADAFRRRYGVLPREVTRRALAEAPAPRG